MLVFKQNSAFVDFFVCYRIVSERKMNLKVFLPEPIAKLRVSRVGSAGTAGGAAEWRVHTRSGLCPPFRRGACRASAPTRWAASSSGANAAPERSGHTNQVCPLPHRRGLASRIACRAATGSFAIGSK